MVTSDEDRDLGAGAEFGRSRFACAGRSLPADRARRYPAIGAAGISVSGARGEAAGGCGLDVLTVAATPADGNGGGGRPGCTWLLPSPRLMRLCGCFASFRKVLGIASSAGLN